MRDFITAFNFFNKPFIVVESNCVDIIIHFFHRLTNLANDSTYGSRKISYNILIPLSKLNKKQVIEEALRLNVPVYLSWSCEKQEDIPCQLCRSCKLRLDSFSILGTRDPLSTI